LKKPVYYYDQSGVVPFQLENGTIKILLITSKKSRRWVIPKGIIEQGLTPLESAIKEAVEEAGVRGRGFQHLLGIYNFKKWGGVVSVKVFPMEVKELLPEWEEEEFRDRRWFDFNEVFNFVDKSELRNIIASLPDELYKIKSG
jgi:8-oxo-dGTP pyrophosphatase MutT (NUDIX family)